MPISVDIALLFNKYLFETHKQSGKMSRLTLPLSLLAKLD